MKNNKVIEVAIIGFGYRGQYLYKLLNNIPLYRVVAVADVTPLQVDELEVPYYSGENCLGKMLGKHKADLVVVASIWDTHFSYAMQILDNRCNVALEVKGALFNGEYEQIVESAKRNRRKVYFLENTVFDKSIMSVVEMCREGLFGEVLWAKGSYRHDLRDLFFSGDGNHWRAKYYRTRRGDIYPTHSIAPVAKAMEAANKECKFKSGGSFATAAKGASLFSGRDEKCTLGDVVTTIVATNNGGQIVLNHDTTLPRPKYLGYEIQGTKGVWCYERRHLCLDGLTPDEEWSSDEELVEKYKSELWQKYENEAMTYDAHHKGMDYVMLCSVAEDLLGVNSYPITNDDMIAWANITLHSELSIKDDCRVNL